MPAPLLALAAVGTIAQGVGAYMQAKNEAKALREKADNSLFQAEEGLYRANLNIEATRQEGSRFAGEQLAQFAGSGVSVSSEATLAALDDTATAVEDQIYKLQREADYEATIRRKEADSYRRAAKDTERAGILTAVGGTAMGAARLTNAGS